MMLGCQVFISGGWGQTGYLVVWTFYQFSNLFVFLDNRLSGTTVSCLYIFFKREISLILPYLSLPARLVVKIQPMIDIRVWAGTGRGELLKIDFCCLAYILTSNLLFTWLACGRWSWTKWINWDKQTSDIRLDHSYIHMVIWCWADWTSFWHNKNMWSKLMTKYQGDHSGSIVALLPSSLQFCNLQTYSATLGSTEKKEILFCCFVFYKTGSHAQTSLSQDVNPL